MPEETILRIEDPVALIWEGQVSAWNALGLAGDKDSHAVRDDAAIVFVRVYDQHGRVPVGYQIRTSGIVAVEIVVV